MIATSFRTVAHTHTHRVIAAIENFVAINSVLQVDLMGQTSAEASGGQLVSSPGGLPDFVRGALDGVGGRSIIARARRRASWPHPAASCRCCNRRTPSPRRCRTQMSFVTEFGVAKVRDLPLDQRAEALIAIAAPQDRATASRPVVVDPVTAGAAAGLTFDQRHSIADRS